MSWQQPSGGFNPNAQSWGAPQQQGGAPPQQYASYQPGFGYQPGYGQQQGGYQQPQHGGYQAAGGYQAPGGYHAGYNQSQGGYNAQGGYTAPASGYQAPAAYGGYQPQVGYQQQQQQGGYQAQSGYNTAPAPAQAPAAAPVVEQKLSQADLVKLGLAKAEVVLPPKREGRGKRITLGGEEPKKEEPKKEEVKVEEVKKEATPVSSPTTASEPTDVAAVAAAAVVTAEKPAPKKKATKTYVRDPRPHYNIVFCGHVDAGKSTINGDLLIAHGAVDEREMAKLKREAEINHREGWEKAYVFDISEEERAKGKTHETGAGYFETKDRRLTVLDAPGHKAFVPSMIGGATQADLAVMVISARRGEFESGFENGGQTREHTTLLRTCGVKYMICVINKMDDCAWDAERYDDIVGRLNPFLKQNGFIDKKNLTFMPVAGLLGYGIAKPVGTDLCPWYKGPYMLEFINKLLLPETRSEKDVLCIPVVGCVKDDGKVLTYGKIESGSLAIGDEITILPTKRTFIVEGIQVENTEIEKAYVGDNVHVRVKGLEESDFHPGFVLTQQAEVGDEKLRSCEFFQAVIMVLDVENILCNGSKVMLHAHAAQEEVVFDKLLGECDPKTLKVIKKDPAFAKAGECVIARLEVSQALVLAPQATFDKMGRFMLRDKGRTIAIGRVLKLYDSTHESLNRTE